MRNRSVLGIWAALAVVFGVFSARGDMGPVTPSGTEIQKIEVVGCPVLGHADPEPVTAPTSSVIKLRMKKGLAGRMAIYRGAIGPAVFGPRGWHCFARYGSGAFILDVRPEPFSASGEPQKGPIGSTNRAVSVEIIDGGTSGRYEAGPIIARLFPDFRAFAESVRDMGMIPRSEFVFAPYPNDRITALAYNAVEFETPGNVVGIGTRGGFEPGSDSIRGIVSVSGRPSEPSVRVLRARLGSELSDVTEEIVRLASDAVKGKADVYAVVSENSDIDWQYLPGEWAAAGECDKARVRIDTDGGWTSVSRAPDGRWESDKRNLFEVFPFESKVCVGEPQTDNISCSVVSRLGRREFISKSVPDEEDGVDVSEETRTRCEGAVVTSEAAETSGGKSTETDVAVDDWTHLISNINRLLLNPYAALVLFVLVLIATAVAVNPLVSNATCVLAVLSAAVLILLLSYSVFPQFRARILERVPSMNDADGGPLSAGHAVSDADLMYAGIARGACVFDARTRFAEYYSRKSAWTFKEVWERLERDFGKFDPSGVDMSYDDMASKLVDETRDGALPRLAQIDGIESSERLFNENLAVLQSNFQIIQACAKEFDGFSIHDRLMRRSPKLVGEAINPSAHPGIESGIQLMEYIRDFCVKVRADTQAVQCGEVLLATRSCWSQKDDCRHSFEIFVNSVREPIYACKRALKPCMEKYYVEHGLLDGIDDQD